MPPGSELPLGQRRSAYRLPVAIRPRIAQVLYGFEPPHPPLRVGLINSLQGEAASAASGEGAHSRALTALNATIGRTEH
jgi:hypothetical protein